MARANENYTMNCSPDNQLACEIGDLTGKFGQLENGYFVHVDNTGLLELGGLRGIVGRSIVVHASNGINFVCGTIRSNIEEQQNVEVITLSATFISPLAGTIYLRQAADEHVVMFGKLFWVNGSPTTMRYNWHIHERAVSISIIHSVGVILSFFSHLSITVLVDVLILDLILILFFDLRQMILLISVLPIEATSQTVKWVISQANTTLLI